MKTKQPVLKNILLFFTLLLFLSPRLMASQPIDEIVIDCNDANILLKKKNKDNLSAEDYFILGVCEYKRSNFEKAYSYLISAKSLNFGKKDTLERILNECKTKISDGGQNIDTGVNLDYSEKKELLIDSYNYKIQVQLLNLIFILIAVSGIFTSAYLFNKSHKSKSNIFLAVFVVAISLALLELVLYWQELFVYAPTVAIYRILFFLWAPSLYLYIKTRFIEEHIYRNKIVLHYLPFSLALICLVIFGNFGDVTNVKPSVFLKGIAVVINNNWIKTGQLIIYLFLIIDHFRSNKNHIEINYKNWLKTLIVFLLILTVYLGARAGFEHVYAFDYMSKYFIAVYLVLFIAILNILLVVQPQVVMGLIKPKTEIENKGKYQNSGLTDNMSERLKSQLLDLLNKDRIFLDNTLTLSKLAKLVNVDRYSVSQVINQELNKNFYELINDYRIEEAVKIIKVDSNKQVIDLIYETGFNNKVSFYKAFKKRMHMTPKDFMDTHYRTGGNS